MNPFLTYPVPSELPRSSGRLYALLDKIHVRRRGSSKLASCRLWALFGAVDADWFDTNVIDPGTSGVLGATRRSLIKKMEVFFLEVDAISRRTVSQIGGSASLRTWVQIRIEQPGEGARLFPNLYTEGFPVKVTDISSLSSSTIAALEEAHDLEEWVDEEETTKWLGSMTMLPEADSLAAYDVGQGSANSIGNTGRPPVVYFDFGGGTRRYVSTRPHPVPAFCLCGQPLIILSHWDDDHWSSGPLIVPSLGLDWLAPYQRVSTPHITFAGSITGTLRVTKAPGGYVASFANLHVHRAHGSNLNNGGLWLQVDAPSSLGGDSFVLPGDAGYQFLRSGVMQAPRTAKLNGIVATHHGANWNSKTVGPLLASPATPVSSNRRVVFSYGPNHYGHPTTYSLNTHKSAGYSDIHTTTRAGSSNRPRSGHVYLDWVDGPLPSSYCSGPNCYPHLDQV